MNTRKNMANRTEYQRNYAKNNRTKVGFDVRRDSKYPKIFDSIPNKAEWFREQLDKYAKEHNYGKLER